MIQDEVVIGNNTMAWTVFIFDLRQGYQTQITQRASLSRWRNNGCTWTLLKTAFTSCYRKIISCYRKIISVSMLV